MKQQTGCQAATRNNSKKVVLIFNKIHIDLLNHNNHSYI